MTTHIQDLDTPALVIDLDAMERNLRRVADYVSQHDLRLRPHTKTHKIPELGRKQVELGAAGLTVAKVSEAEVMLRSGTPDLLVAYPTFGEKKLRRLTEVTRDCKVTVAVDSTFAASEISAAARSAGCTIGLLAEMDAGLHRVGVELGAPLTELVEKILSLPNVTFEGLTFYPGHIRHADGQSDEAIQTLSGVVSEAVGSLERSGIEVRVVSGGSTPALYRSHEVQRMNEIRPGTYIFNDRNTWLSGACAQADCAATMLTTVVSTAVSGQIIIDGGSKTFSSDRAVLPDAPGFGYLIDAPGAVFEKMNEEHGYVNTTECSRKWSLGEKVRIIPNHICVAMNLHERVYGVRGEEVVEVWEVEGRGKLQ